MSPQRTFPERDWRYLRSLQPIALNKYCVRVLAECEELMHNPTASPHENYLALWDHLIERNELMASAFDDVRRSTALQRLAAMLHLEVLTAAELEGFTDDVRESAVVAAENLSETRVRPGQRSRRKEPLPNDRLHQSGASH